MTATPHSEPALLVERSGPVATVTLNRPALHNAFDDALVERLHAAAADLAGDAGVRVAVLAGNGASFCAGADLNWMQRMVDYTEEENLADSTAMARMFEAWYRLPKPVVGRIHGAALGGGLGLVSVCDVAVASTKAVFGFTEIRLGILPAVISPFALAKIGPGAARALFLTGERFDAERALALGLVQRVAAPGDLDDAVAAVVRDLLAGGPEAQARIKELVGAVAGIAPEDARDLTAGIIAGARAGAEGQEGIRAFLERRRAAWREDAP
jgi:methylglutaconyl-CoA hydratase